MKHIRNLAGLTAGFLALIVMPEVASAQETATEAAAETTPVAITEVDGKTVAVLAPENTRIEFVGTHVGDDPKPRLGGFKTFKGTIGVQDNKPVSINVEMEITSVWTEYDDLTKHLMNEDFFQTEKFPSATFASTSIEVADDDTCTIAGDLTLHGTTSEIKFPGKFKMEEGGLVLMAEFTLDRAQFGMDQMTDGVEKEVSLSVVVGQATRGMESKEGNGNDQASVETESMNSLTVKVSLPNMT